MSPHLIEYMDYLYSALNAERGLVLNSSDPKKCRDNLYAARRQAEDESLSVLSVVLPSHKPSEVWIVKQGATSNGS